MNFDWEDFSPKENALYGEELAKGAAHRAVRELFDRRIHEGKKQEEIADKIGKDPAWLSRSIKGPANWTLKTLGALVVALDGKLTIKVGALEDHQQMNPSNYDAYDAIDCELYSKNRFWYPLGCGAARSLCTLEETEITEQNNTSQRSSMFMAVGSAS